MITQSRDTNPEVEKVWITMLGKLSDEERFLKLISMSSTFVRLSKRTIAEVNPKLNKTELDLLFVKYNYGDEMAERLKKYLELRNNATV
ncbi:MAG: hypothetical protein V1720_10270 [bacterium]